MRPSVVKKLLSIGVAMSIVLFGFSAYASQSRMNALSNNPLVLDMVDVADFPGLLTMFGNAGFVTVNPTIPTGNAGVFVGDSMVFGVWVLREPKFNDLETTSDVFTYSNGQIPNTYNVADVFFGMDNGFGIRASLNTGLATTDTLDSNDDLQTTGSFALGIEVQPGFTFVQKGYRGDFGLGLSFSNYKITVGGNDLYTGRMIPSVLIRHRSTLGNYEDTLNWVFDVLFTRRAYGASDKDNDDTGDIGDWLASVTVGPKLKLPHDFTVTAGLQALFETRGGKIDGDKTPRRMALGVPGLVLSAELYVLEVLAIRAGVDYGVYWGSHREYNNDDEMDERNRLMGQRFNWSFGLGVQLGNFEIDGTLSQQLIIDGPNIIGGTAPGFLSMLTATYGW